MSSESVIHIKLDYLEALKARRNILSSEMSSLNIVKYLSRYRLIRMEELKLRARLYGKMKEVKLNIKKLQSLLPNPKVPKMLKREEPKEDEPEKDESSYDSYNEGDIEFQLRQIQKRLTELQTQDVE